MCIKGESLSNVTPDNIRISRKKKRKTPDSLVIRKELIGDTVNPGKIPKDYTVTDVEKYSLHQTPKTFRNKVDYEGDTNENNCCTDYSQTVNDDCVRNLDKE